MTPLRFEALYNEDWSELEAALVPLLGERRRHGGTEAPLDGARVAALYRRACEHLALARARSYPAHLVERLERLTTDAHQVIYFRNQVNTSRIKEIAAVEFPQAVRRHAAYLAVATALFVVPAIVLLVLVWRQPELILSLVSPETAASFERMYSTPSGPAGRVRTASDDWMMFGHYIRNNIGIAFQCFAAGIVGGVGSVFFLVFNGAFAGAIAGYLTARGFSANFYGFVVTHSSFELIAIVLAGAAGLRIGHSIWSPGRRSRRRALVDAARESVLIVYGAVGLLVVAAAIEAFWSPITWLPATVKYGVAAMCWAAVPMYLILQGRRAR